MVSFSSHGSSSMGDGFTFSYSSDDEILKQLFVHMVRQRQCVFACAIVVFNANEFEKGVG
jgi:predicted small metal-binding protein